MSDWLAAFAEWYWPYFLGSTFIVVPTLVWSMARLQRRWPEFRDHENAEVGRYGDTPEVRGATFWWAGIGHVFGFLLWSWSHGGRLASGLLVACEIWVATQLLYLALIFALSL